MARLAMLDSVAYWTLKPIEVRILQVIEIEHMRHGGVENGNLITTRRQLEKRSIPHKAIAPGLRALEALGFIEITQRGAAGIGDHAQAHRFRLTYVQPNPTDEWRKHHDADRAEAEANSMRNNADVRARRIGLRGGKKRKAGCQTEPGKGSKWNPVSFSEGAKMASIGFQTEPGAGVQMEPTIYISGGRAPVEADTAPPPSLATPLADDAPTPGDALLPNAPTTLATARPRLVWARPVVREMTGAEAILRRNEINAAGRNAQVADPVRLATIH